MTRLAKVCGIGAFAAICALAPAAASEASAKGSSKNNYYSYRDADGVLHVTNVKGRKGNWKLYKSLEGSGGSSPRAATVRAPRRRRPVNVGSDRVRRYDSIVAAAARRYQLPAALIRAVMHTESNFNPRAVSSVGAMGLMQLMPSTARFLGVDHPFEPQQNVHGGARLLRMLANRYDGNMVLVLAAYNAGAGNVEKYGGVPPFEQTRNYVRAVLRRYYAYQRQGQLAASAGRPEPARHLEP